MKRTALLLALGLVFVSGSVFAAKSVTASGANHGTYGTAGCGLGSIVFGNKPGFIQVVAATLNSLGYNQSFGISFGTSNCVSDDDGRTAELFIIGNREALEKDIARGNGEALVNLSEMIGCRSHKALGAKLQKNYTEIFPNQSVGSEQVSKSILALSDDCGNA